MHATLKKMNLKEHGHVHVVNAPDSFDAVLTSLDNDVRVTRGAHVPQGCPFVIAFATQQAQVDQFAAEIATKTDGDAVVWAAYPKGSSKRYACEFNRDTGWAKLGAAGFEPVRQVAVDEDWSALRFRRVEHIKQMTRATTLSSKGKERIAGGSRKN